MVDLAEVFRIMTPLVYWMLIILWTFIFFFYIRRIRVKKYKNLMLHTLFLVLSIDSFRTLFESTFFGAWYTSLSGLIPQEIYKFLVQPQIVFIPKIINLIVSFIIIFILLRKWIPQELEHFSELQDNLESLDRRLKILSQSSNVTLWNHDILKGESVGEEILEHIEANGQIVNKGQFLVGFDDLLKGNTSEYTFDFKLQDADWQVTWIRCEIYSQLLENGNRQLLGINKNVTEQRSMEERIYEERDKLYRIFDSIDAIISVSDTDTYEILYANKYTENLYGLEIIGKPCYSAFHNLDKPCSFCINSLLNEMDDETYSGEFFSEITNRYYLNNVRYIKWYDGRQVRLEIAYDNTENRKREEYLLKLESAFNQSPTSIIVTDYSGKIEYVNKKTCEVTGYSEIELLGQNPDILKSGELDESYYDDMWGSIRRGGSWSGLFHNKKKNGDFFWEEAFISPIYNREGEMSHFIATKVDITEKMQLEKERSLLSYAMENISDMIVILGLDRRIEYVNKAFESITGYTREEVKGFKVDFLRSGDFSDFEDEEVWKSLESGQLWSGQFINKKKDGTLYTEQTVINPLVDEYGNISNYVEIKRDISEDLKIQEQLQQRTKMDVVGQLAGGVAHDFNNALSGIMSASQLLMHPGRNLDERSKKYVDMIFEASMRASQLSNRLLTFSRTHKSQFDVLDLHQIIGEVLEIMKNTFDKKITITPDLQASKSIMSGNNSELHSAILNLCINAWHAMPGGGALRLVTTNLQADEEFCQNSSFEISPGNYIGLEIRDEGTGIPKENLNKIFEPYFTTKEHGEGTGLGLAAVYGTVRNHKGFLHVESELGKGTSIFLNFPLSENRKEYAVVEQISEVREESEYKGYVLVVDDEEINRIVISDIVEAMGYTALTAADGAEALELYRDNEIRFVLLDMIMPVMNGSETFMELRKIDGQCKIIISSGYNEIKDLEHLRRLGIEGELKKPFTITELQEIVRKIEGV